MAWQQEGGYQTEAGAPPWFSDSIQLALSKSASIVKKCNYSLKPLVN
jgi:hypothetical protein